MNNNNFKAITSSKLLNFNPGELDLKSFSKYREVINDNNYFNFVLATNNCGFFFDQSLQIYSYSSINEFNDIDNVNILFQGEYKHIFEGLITFGQDLFGNQFCFNVENDEVIFFNSETGEREILAPCFENWIDIISNQSEYYTGINTLKMWLINNQLSYDQRLYPIIPFIMGGEFTINNLFAIKFPEFIISYCNIARQVYDLPDGTPVKLNIGKPD